MGWNVFGAALVGVLCLADASAKAAIITNPDWLRRPTAEDMAKTFPDLATGLHLSGRAIISCAVNTAGRARNCKVVSEQPAGLGFGQAALELSDVFRFSPRKLDGRAVPGGSVQIPIRFNMPEAEPLPFAPSLPPASPAAKTLAARLVPSITGFTVEAYALRVERSISEAGPSVDPAVAAAARRAFREAATRLAPDWATATAAVYASLLTETELASEVAFVTSPAGEAIRRQALTTTEEEANSFERWRRAVAAHGRPAFCATQSCVAAAWRAPEGLASAEDAWSGYPHLAQVQEHAPPIPLMFDIAGWAQLNCYAEEEGVLRTCIVARDSPENLGFGVAALQLSDRYVLSPEKAKALAGKMIAVQVRFPVKPAPEPETPAGDQPVTAESLALARQVLAAGDFDGDFAKTQADLEQFVTLLNPGEAVSAAAITALRGAARPADEATRTYYAQRMASRFTMAELKSLLAYHQSPAAKGRRRNQEQFAVQFKRIHTDHSRRIEQEARRLFCAERDCTISPPPKP